MLKPIQTAKTYPDTKKDDQAAILLVLRTGLKVGLGAGHGQAVMGSVHTPRLEGLVFPAQRHHEGPVQRVRCIFLL